MEEQGVHPTAPPFLHLLSAFLAMEPTHSLVSLARDCGGGLITEGVQRFIWDNCVSTVEESYAPYLKNFLKKLINEIESFHGDVLDELYEQYASYLSTMKGDNLGKENSRVLKCISFIFPRDCFEVPSCSISMKLVVPLHCSLNMLEGDTGCSIWPSGLFLSEFILSRPEIFSNKSCFEVGSGVGLVGICLAHVKASKVILSEGDLSSLANMKLNLELNQLSTRMDNPETTNQDTNLVKCTFLPWESAEEGELQDFAPDIVLGADVIYNPLCLPHLIRVLAILLNRTISSSHPQKDSRPVMDAKVDGADDTFEHDRRKIPHKHASGRPDASAESDSDGTTNGAPNTDFPCSSKSLPVAYIASVIRNIDTFNQFLALAEKANLAVKDVTDQYKSFDLLPYMKSYDRSAVRLFTVVFMQ